jgi:hypothetical protein
MFVALHKLVDHHQAIFECLREIQYDLLKKVEFQRYGSNGITESDIKAICLIHLTKLKHTGTVKEVPDVHVKIRPDGLYELFIDDRQLILIKDTLVRTST